MDYDRTPLPEVYRIARTLPPETMDVWGRAIRAMLPVAVALERVVDLGCGTARFALPLADGSVDLVFASMVYHHLRPEAALAEARRVLRPRAHLMLRTPTRESVGEFAYQTFFPEALAIDEERMPSRRALIDACEAAGFALRGHELVRQRFADDHADYYRKISLRGLSALLLISDDQFARGLREFAAYCQSAERHQPVYESVELFL